MDQNSHTSACLSSNSISPALHGLNSLFATIISILFIGLIATISILTQCVLIFFPELAALSYDVFRRPQGTWAISPLLLVLTPVATAVLGIFISLRLSFGFSAVLLAVFGSILIVQLMRSPIAPAISAGLLPVVLHVNSWLYPLCILLGTVLLVGSLKLWQVYAIPRLPVRQANLQEIVDDRIEWIPRRRTHLSLLFIFTFAMIALAQWTGLRLILFPPLIVIAYEMLSHPNQCPWAKKPLRMPFACALSALGGMAFMLSLGPGVMSTLLSMLWGVLILQVFALHVPPALAVSLIPQIMETPDYWYPLSVLIGTVSLSMLFLMYRRTRRLCDQQSVHTPGDRSDDHTPAINLGD
jgi:hypothetical protein